MNQSEPPNTHKGFEWIEYRGKQQICYVKDFIEQSKVDSPDFLKSLDLPNLSEGSIATKPANLSEVTDSMYKKIVMHGALESTNKIARRTGALRKDDCEKDHNYYDQDDSFIDDEVQQGNQNKNQMRLVYAEYDDFACFEGSLADFITSDIYDHRLSILQNVGREPIPSSPKRKAAEDLPPAEYKSQKKTNDKPNEKTSDKTEKAEKGVDKIKKKVKKTQDKVQQTPIKADKTADAPHPISAPKPPMSSEIKKESVAFLMPNMPNMPGMPNMPNQQPGMFYGPQMPQMWQTFPGMFPMGSGHFQSIMYHQIPKRPNQVIQIDED